MKTERGGEHRRGNRNPQTRANGLVRDVPGDGELLFLGSGRQVAVCIDELRNDQNERKQEEEPAAA